MTDILVKDAHLMCATELQYAVYSAQKLSKSNGRFGTYQYGAHQVRQFTFTAKRSPNRITVSKEPISNE